MENGKWRWKWKWKMKMKAKNARNWAITHKCTLTWKLMAHLCTVTLRRVFFITSMRCYFVSIDGQILQPVLILYWLGWLNFSWTVSRTNISHILYTRYFSEVHETSCITIESSHSASFLWQQPSLDSSVRLRATIMYCVHHYVLLLKAVI